MVKPAGCRSDLGKVRRGNDSSSTGTTSRTNAASASDNRPRDRAPSATLHKVSKFTLSPSLRLQSIGIGSYYNMNLYQSSRLRHIHVRTIRKRLLADQ